jgi:hypothetical protein
MLKKTSVIRTSLTKNASASAGLFDRLMCAAQAHYDADEIEKALKSINCLLEDVPKWPDSSMKFMPSPSLDAFLERLGERCMQLHFSDIELAESSVREADVLILTSALLKTGGHTREIEDWVSGLDSTRTLLMTSEPEHCSNSAVVEQISQRITYVSHKYESPVETIEWLVRTIARINPKRLIVSPSHRDVALLTALAVLRFDGKLIINLNLDHNVSPALFLDRVDHIIVKRPYLYCVIKNEYKLPKVIYIPFARRPSLDQNRLAQPVSQDVLSTATRVTCSCTSSIYKIENDYVYRYSEVISDLIIQTGSRHIHIGAISDECNSMIQDRLERSGIPVDRFIHVSYAERLSDVFHDYGVEIFIQTFPVGGGLVAVEAMEAGLMLISHRPYNSKLYNPVDFCYQGSVTWSQPSELFQIIAELDDDKLQEHSQNAVAHYRQFNRPGAMEGLLTSGDLTGYPVDEEWCNALFDYPLDSFRVHANRNARSKLNKTLSVKLKREAKRFLKRIRCYISGS